MKRLAVLVALAACGADSTPSCEQAIEHYYLAGCRYLNPDLTPSMAFSEPQAVALCLDRVARAAACRVELEAWLDCNNAVPAGSTGTECCSATDTALVNCEPI